MSTEQRESGYYFVKYQGNWHIGEWSLADECWWLTGTDLPYGEPEFDEIDPEPIIRKEYFEPVQNVAMFDGTKLREFWAHLQQNRPDASMSEIFRFLLEQNK